MVDLPSPVATCNNLPLLLSSASSNRSKEIICVSRNKCPSLPPLALCRLLALCNTAITSTNSSLSSGFLLPPFLWLSLNFIAHSFTCSAFQLQIASPFVLSTYILLILSRVLKYSACFSANSGFNSIIFSSKTPPLFSVLCSNWLLAI